MSKAVKKASEIVKAVEALVDVSGASTSVMAHGFEGMASLAKIEEWLIDTMFVSPNTVSVTAKHRDLDITLFCKEELRLESEPEEAS